MTGQIFVFEANDRSNMELFVWPPELMPPYVVVLPQHDEAAAAKAGRLVAAAGDDTRDPWREPSWFSRGHKKGPAQGSS